MKMKAFAPPALVLLFLSPVIGELLSGSAPPAEFFNPLGFTLLVILYGGGAILARELTHRWDKGWPTLLVLGAAYGIIEEGLMVKSFFDPQWQDLDMLGSYGRSIGVNWIWTLELTLYHAVFSIAIPVLLVNLMFPAYASRAWISQRTFNVLSLLFVVNGVFIFAFITPYRPPIIHYLPAVLVTILLIMLAHRLPKPKPGLKNVKLANPFWFGLISFLTTAAIFISVWLLPHTNVPPWQCALFLIGVVALAGWIILELSNDGAGLTARHQLALATGGLGFFILLSPLQELDSARSDNTTGMTLVALAATLFLAWMAWRTRRLEKLDSHSRPNMPQFGEMS